MVCRQGKSDGVRRAPSIGAIVDMLEARRYMGALTPDIAIRKPTGTVSADFNRSGKVSRSWKLPKGTLATDRVLAGDFNGDTVSDMAVFGQGIWRLDYRNDRTVNATVTFGDAASLPVVGDVNGDGLADLAVYDPSTGIWQVDTDRNGTADITFTFKGDAGSAPLMADFDSDGRADATLFAGGSWLVDLGTNGVAPGTSADRSYNFADGTYTPVVMDFNGDGNPDLGAYAGGLWFCDTDYDGQADLSFRLGTAADQPLPGYYNTSKSVFVSPTGSDRNSGSVSKPVKTLTRAVKLATRTRLTIRLAPGSYAQNVYINSKSNLGIYGAGMLATQLIAPVGDALFLDMSADAIIGSMGIRATASGARGVVVRGSSATLIGVNTTGTDGDAVLGANYNGVISRITVRNSHIDGSVTGRGVYLQDEGIATTIQNSTVNGNAGGGVLSGAAAPITISNSVFSGNGGDGMLLQMANVSINSSSFVSNKGRGIALLGASAPLVWNNVVSNANVQHNLILATQDSSRPDLTVTGGTFNASQTGHGVWLQGGVTARFTGTAFSNNGSTSGTVAHGILVEGGSDLTLTSSEVQANSGDGILARLSTLKLVGVRVDANRGRGVAVMGSNLTADDTSGSRNRLSNLLAINIGSVRSIVDLRNSRWNESEIGSGIELQNGTTATISNCVVDRNGTRPAAAGEVGVPSAPGYGIVVDGDSQLSLQASQIRYNTRIGVAAVTSSRLSVNQAVIANNVQNGLLISGQANLLLAGSTISDNGLVRDVVNGYNGVEFLGEAGRAYAGHAELTGNVFRSNTGFGVFIGSGTDITIYGNVFEDSPVGIGLDCSTETVSATIKGNSFQTPSKSLFDTGVFLFGARASAVIGGHLDADKNTFTGFANQFSIYGTRLGGDPPRYLGDPVMASDAMLLAENIFQDCGPTPIGHG